MRRKKVLFLLGLGLLLALYSAVASGALSQVLLDRDSDAASTVDDSIGALALSGFNNNSYALNTTYRQAGTITNKNAQALNLSIYIDPNITSAKNGAAWTLTVRIVTGSGTTYNYPFSGTGISNPAGVWTTGIQIQPGEAFTVSTRLVISKTGSFTAPTVFGFSATGAEGISLLINDTAAVPRRHNYTG